MLFVKNVLENASNETSNINLVLRKIMVYTYI